MLFGINGTLLQKMYTIGANDRASVRGKVEISAAESFED